MLSFFFFQVEDGIRAGHVTGVQTCALPISCLHFQNSSHAHRSCGRRREECGRGSALWWRAAAVFLVGERYEIGRASCRERGEILVAGVSECHEERWPLAGDE